MPKYILIEKNDYKYVDYDSYEQVEQALNDYLCETFSLSKLNYNDRALELDDDSLLYCCSADGMLEINGNEYDPELEMQEAVTNEFNGDAEEFVQFLIDAGYCIIGGDDFNTEFKFFMADVVFEYQSGELKLNIDFDDMFTQIHQNYDIDTAVGCIQEIIS